MEKPRMIYDKSPREPEKVDLPAEPVYSKQPGIETIEISGVPMFIKTQLKYALDWGRFKKSMDHWVPALDGSGIVDEATINKLRDCQKRASNNYQEAKPIFNEIAITLDSLHVESTNK